MTGAEVELVAQASPQVQRAVAYWALPARLRAVASSYLRDDGTVDMDALLFACERLDMLHVDVIENLPDTFVVPDKNKGTFSFGMYAALQRALIARSDYRIDFKEVTDDHVTAVMVFPNGRESSPLTINGDLGDIKRYAKRNAKNYDEKPRRMYEARVTTELVSLYAADALRNIARAAGVGAIELGDSGPASPGEVRSSNPEPPPRSVAPDGSTIPEYLREPEVDPEVRAQLIARIEALAPEVRDDLLEVVKPYKLPNIRTNRLTKAHAALLDRLINETLARHQTVVRELSDPAAPGSRHPVAAAGPEPDSDRVPAHVYDQTPEARGYAPNDPARPYE
jgi:hypothetical protein